MAFLEFFTKTPIILTPKKLQNPRVWYIMVFVLMTFWSIAACFVTEAPRWADTGSSSSSSSSSSSMESNTTDANATSSITTSSSSGSSSVLTLDKADISWLLTSSALVLLMTPGVAFFYGGMVGTKNVISTMLQSFACMGVISLHWVVVDFSLSFGEDVHHYIGSPWTYWMFHNVGGEPDGALCPTIPLALYAVFQMMFAVITPALISGGFAERVRFPAFITYIILWITLVYCPLAHWSWHPEGFLRKWGVLDFAGGTVVHMSSGWAALAGALVLGRRRTHVEKEKVPPANVAFVILGASLLWFGWFGFNAGSAVASNELAVLAFLTTNTAAAMASVTWLIFEGALGRKPTAVGACTGAVVGLVAITPGAGFVSVQSSFFIGYFTAIMCNMTCWLKGKSGLDDTLDAFCCHGMGGMTGMILTGFFAVGVGVTAGSGYIFGYHWAALIIVALYAFFMSLTLFKVLQLFMPLRVEDWEEEEGLDATQHGESMYAGLGMDASMYSTGSAVKLMPAASGSAINSRKPSIVMMTDEYRPPSADIAASTTLGNGGPATTITVAGPPNGSTLAPPGPPGHVCSHTISSPHSTH